jgi:hypothetical protein
MALGQVMAQRLGAGLLAQPAAAVPAALRPDEVMATIEKPADLKAKGILTEEAFSVKPAELLKILPDSAFMHS